MSLLGNTISCFHRTAPTVTKGRISSAPTRTAFSINGSIQESTQAELSSLPEARRLQAGTYTILTFDVLLTIDNDVNSDIVIFNGSEYEVVTKATWANNLINHNVYLIQEIRPR